MEPINETESGFTIHKRVWHFANVIVSVGTCKTAEARGFLEIFDVFRMFATRRRSVSDMLILLGTTSEKPGAADEVVTGYAILVLGENSRRTFPVSRGDSRFLSESCKALVTVVDMTRLDAFVPHWQSLSGRPVAERAAVARAFVAKAVLNLPTTRMLIERVQADKTLRRIWDWARPSEVPSESTFSRAFAEFAESELPSRMHEALIQKTHADRLVGHIARDSTAIEGHERPRRAEEAAASEPVAPKPAPWKRERPRKGEEPPPKPPTRLERQADMSPSQMLADLPRPCDVGCKRNAKGYKESWVGYNLHVDTADGDIPVSCILTSASVHDSQVPIPLATMTTGRLVNLYDLMDSAYDAAEIEVHSRKLGDVPIIDVNPRRDVALKQELAMEEKRRALVDLRLAEDARYNERGGAERVNANLKDKNGGRTVQVRGPGKVMCHLMFGVLVIAATQIIRLVT